MFFRNFIFIYFLNYLDILNALFPTNKSRWSFFSIRESYKNFNPGVKIKIIILLRLLLGATVLNLTDPSMLFACLWLVWVYSVDLYLCSAPTRLSRSVSASSGHQRKYSVLFYVDKIFINLIHFNCLRLVKHIFKSLFGWNI